MEKIQDAMKDCSSVKGDWAKMKKMAEVFKHPKSFAWHIAGDVWHNRVNISKEVHTAVDDWKSQQWYDFGKNCGEAAANVFIGKVSQEWMDKEKLAAVHAGFLNSFGGKFSLLNLLLCINQQDQALLMLDISYQAFSKALKDKTW